MRLTLHGIYSTFGNQLEKDELHIMQSLEYFFGYMGYISTSTLIAYPLLAWKQQQPKTLRDLMDVILLNFFLFGLLPLTPFLMRHPPDEKYLSSDSYYIEGKIWIWNK